MVDEEITDGKRIAQLLASELTGLAEGPLDDVSVEEADPAATPDPAGSEAYTISVDGDVIASVYLYPAACEVSLQRAWEWPEDSDATITADGRLRLASGASVKAGVDAVRRLLEENSKETTDSRS